jgi:cytochrome c-type biogenesis protein CcmE
MKPRYRNQRLAIFSLCAVAAVLGATLVLKALQENKQFFKNPSDVVNLSYVQGDREIRIGGLVVDDSIVKGQGLVTEFSLINFENADDRVPALNVLYEGVLPDLFREGQGVVITGKLNNSGVFIASNVLAKHDENYMPKMPESVAYQSSNE